MFKTSSKENNILIEIVETEEAVLAGEKYYQIMTSGATGVLRVVNPNDKSRIWNVNLDVGETIGTSITQNSAKEGIDAGESWDLNYSLEEIKPILKLTEVVNANADAGEVDPYFVYNAKDTCAITISLENQIGFQFRM